ncbi:hypothetical protein CS8_027440 [Cupriavidus sp. 8B]
MKYYSLALAQTDIGQADRLRMADRIADQAFLVQTVQRAPVQALPCATFLAQVQVEQREDHFVDGIGIEIHDGLLSGVRHDPVARCQGAASTSIS